MAYVRTSQEIDQFLSAAAGSLGGMRRYNASITTLINKSRAAGDTEATIKTRVNAMLATLASQRTELQAALTAIPLDHHDIDVASGRPPLNARMAYMMNSFKYPGELVVSPIGSLVFDEFDAGDTVEIYAAEDSDVIGGGIITSVGKDIVYNGDFATSSGTVGLALGWDNDADWVHNSGHQVHAAGGDGEIRHDARTDDDGILKLIRYGNRFTLTYDIANWTAGNIVGVVGGTAGDTKDWAVEGASANPATLSVSEPITVDGTQPDLLSVLYFYSPDAAFVGYIDNVTLTPLDWVFIRPSEASRGSTVLYNVADSKFGIRLKER